MFSFSRLMIITIMLLSSSSKADVFDSAETAQKEETTNDIFSFFDKNSVTFFKKAKIIIMNKITANSKEFELSVGSKAKYGKAELEMHKCAKTSDPETGSMMLVTLKDTKISEDEKIIFSGWLASKSPSLSAVEHPVYQLLAVSCS